MSLLRRVAGGLRALVRPQRGEQELDAELRDFLESAVERKLRAGFTPDEALRAARLELGSAGAVKERVRDVGWESAIESVWRDVVYAFRGLRRSPGFTAVAVLTLAVGIGANTAIYSLVNALMLRSLPVRHPDQLVEMLFKYPGDPRMNSYPWKHYQRFRDQNHVFSDLIAMSRGRLQVTGSAVEPEVVDGVYVSANFFDALGLRPAIGRLIGPEEDQIGSNRAAVTVISWSYWQSRFNLDPAVLGKSLVVNDVPVTIVGVTPRGFFGLLLGMNPPLWMPVAMEPLTQKPSRLADGSLSVGLVARLKPGVTIAQARTEMRTLDQPRLAELESRSRDVQWRGATIDVEPAGAGLSVLRDRFAATLLLMMSAVGVLLLVACINVASMLLARGAARRREMAVRVALGAGRLRIVRQMLIESLVLSTMGGLCGIALAYAGANALVAIIASGRSPVGMPQPLEIPVHLDLHVLLFAAGATVGTGLLFGFAPAWNAFVAAPSPTLREIGSTAGKAGWRRFGQGLVVAQVALSVILLSAAAVFTRHLMDLRTVGLGFQSDSVLQLRLDWSRSTYAPAQLGALNRQLLDRMASIPGVRSVSLAGMTPISGAGGSQFINVQGFVEKPDDRRRVSLNVIAPRYFETLGTPLMSGRDFVFEDEGRQRVAIVNQALVRYYFGTSNPLGRQFTYEGQSQPYEIVGVVGDAKYHDLHETPPRTVYMNAFQGSRDASAIVVLRTDVRPMAVAAAVRRTAGEVLPIVPVAKITTLAEQVDASILPERLIAMLSALFGILAALLVAIGLYGLLAYTVSQRISEIGIRIAFGATSRDVTWMVLRNALGFVSAGLLIGVPIALRAKGYASNLLVTVASTQARAPITLPVDTTVPVVVSAIAMLAVALFASYVPVRRAIAVDPIVALRVD
jgi:putative ABC transport system permease protein